MDSQNPHEKHVSPGAGPMIGPTVRRRRIRVRRSWLSRHYRWVLAGVVALSLSCLFWYSGRAPRERDWEGERAEATASIPIVPAVLDDREYYPYSVIPGGVRTAEELRDAIRRDPVVAKHYADFNLDRVRVERLTQPRLMHVSYRIGQRIFWTGKLLHIKAGETVLTDGVNCARGRCGNRLSETLGKAFVPPIPEMAEMSEESFDTPAFGTPPTIVSLLPEGPQMAAMPLLPPPIITATMSAVVEAPVEWAPVPRRLFPPVLTGPGTPSFSLIRPTLIASASPTDVSAPEPATLAILAGSLLFLWLGRKRIPVRS